MTQIKRRYTLQQAEALLEKKYLGKYCSFDYPGYDTVYGRVDQIAIDTTKDEPLVVIQMNDKRYTCSVDATKECLTLLKR